MVMVFCEWRDKKRSTINRPLMLNSWSYVALLVAVVVADVDVVVVVCMHRINAQPRGGALKRRDKKYRMYIGIYCEFFMRCDHHDFVSAIANN